MISGHNIVRLAVFILHNDKRIHLMPNQTKPPILIPIKYIIGQLLNYTIIQNNVTIN